MLTHPQIEDIRYQVQPRHGPVDVIGRYVLLAHRVAQLNGIHLSIGPVELLSDINRSNRASWAPLFPGLDVRCSEVGEHNAFAVIGRNQNGDIICTQGCRLYDFTGTTFTAAAEDMTFWYTNPHAHLSSGDTCVVRAWAGKLITGRADYAGATWVHPDYRGNYLVQILPRLVRAVGTTKWGPNAIFGIMAEPLVKNGLLRHNGFRNHEWSVDLSSATIGTYRFKLLWEKPADLAEDLAEYLDSSPSEAAHAESAGSSQQKALAV